jgi:hypothetical protein
VLLEQSLRVRFKPQRTCRAGRIDGELVPPSGFVPVAMQFAMMSSAQRDGELIANLAAECSILCEAQMVGIAAAARRLSNIAGPQSAHAHGRGHVAAQDGRGRICPRPLRVAPILPFL